MLSENRWKVLLVVVASAAVAEPNRALSLVYRQPYKNYMFVSKNYKKSRQRVLFLDEDENHQPYGQGEIDLTQNYDSKIKFDDAQDYEFTSPEETALKPEETSGNERFYEPLPRFRPGYQAYPNHYQGRYSRPYAPTFGFDAVRNGYYDFAPALRNGYYGNSNGWKARSPRVVFPYASENVNSVQTNSHAGPGGVDNVVFRDQNFGISDLGTDEQNLQDIGTGNADAFAERDFANAPHRVPKREQKNEIKVKKKLFLKPMFIQTEGIKPRYKRIDYFNANTTLPKFKPITDDQINRINEIMKELSTNPSTNNKHTKGRRGKMVTHDNFDSPEELQNIKGNLDASRIEVVSDPMKEDRNDEKTCPQGGTCEFFFYCWMVGGLLDGSCGGVLKGCCHRVAKAGLLGVQDSNSIEFTPREGLTYGPVINDDSKWLELVGSWSLSHRWVIYLVWHAVYNKMLGLYCTRRVNINRMCSM